MDTPRSRELVMLQLSIEEACFDYMQNEGGTWMGPDEGQEGLTWNQLLADIRERLGSRQP